MSSTESWTIKRLLEWTTDYLKDNGSESPRLDAEVLLAEAVGCQRIQLYTSYDQIPPEEQLTVFRSWIRERAAGKPVAYLVGHREFYSLPFAVNEHVLIPRPETELLVTMAIDFLEDRPPENSVVCDLGTGSGCIAVAIAKNRPHAQLTAVDISEQAVEVARKNAEQNGVGDRIRVTQSDLLDSIEQPEYFDLIVSNPPYIGTAEKNDLAVDVLNHEPHQALFAGEAGTEVIARLAAQAARRLKPGGQLMFEISPMIADACVEIVQSHSEFENVEINQDLSKLPRVVSASRK